MPGPRGTFCKFWKSDLTEYYTGPHAEVPLLPRFPGERLVFCFSKLVNSDQTINVRKLIMHVLIIDIGPVE